MLTSESPVGTLICACPPETRIVGPVQPPSVGSPCPKSQYSPSGIEVATLPDQLLEPPLIAMNPLLPLLKAIWLSQPSVHLLTLVPNTEPRNMPKFWIARHLCSQTQPFSQPKPPLKPFGCQPGGPSSGSEK